MAGTKNRAAPADALRPLRRVTIDDVARAAGVSRQTVSNVVNSRGRLGADTRDRVLAQIDALGYRAHRGATSMRTQRTRQIAHPVARTELTPGNMVMADFIQALVAGVDGLDQHILMAAPGADPVGQIADLARSGSVDAFVLADLAAHDPRVAMLARLEMPFAAFGRTDEDMPQTWVDIDNEGAVRRIVEMLVAGGHQRIAFLGFELDTPWDRAREAGYRAAMEAAGLEGSLARTGHDTASTGRLARRLLEHDAAFTAVVTGSDTLAAMVYSVAGQLGRKIGPDLAVTGFDGGAISQLLFPTLTTVRIPLDDIARRVVERALAEVDEPSGRPGEIVEVHLQRGDSAP